MKRVLIGVVLASAAAVGCGGGGDSGPKTPTAPSVTSVNITTEGNMLWIGSSVTLAASSNNGPITGCSWGGDAPSVLSVNAGTGQITGMSAGEVTVWCDYQGVRGTKRLRVLPNYSGTYLGSYSITSCTDSGFFRGMCGANFPNGRALPLRFDFQQNTDSLSGKTSLGSLTSEDFVATVRVDGTVQIRSRYSGSGNTIRQTWNLNSRTAGRIEGTVEQVWENNIYVGQAVINGALYNTNRQLTAMPLLTVPANRLMTLEDLLRAVVGQ